MSKIPTTAAFVSQKGGVGKSALARLLAIGAIHRGRKTLLADFDLDQLTCVEWGALRLRASIEPEVDARAFKSLKKLRKQDGGVEFIVADTRGLADDLSTEIAEDFGRRLPADRRLAGRPQADLEPGAKTRPPRRRRAARHRALEGRPVGDPVRAGGGDDRGRGLRTPRRALAATRRLPERPRRRPRRPRGAQPLSCARSPSGWSRRCGRAR